jgi:hypothetical protein
MFSTKCSSLWKQTAVEYLTLNHAAFVMLPPALVYLAGCIPGARWEDPGVAWHYGRQEALRGTLPRRPGGLPGWSRRSCDYPQDEGEAWP